MGKFICDTCKEDFNFEEYEDDSDELASEFESENVNRILAYLKIKGTSNCPDCLEECLGEN